MKRLALGLFIFFALTLTAQVHTLKESVYFELGKSSLNREHKKKLDSIVTMLKTSRSYVGEIKGYTCTLGSAQINRVISNLRALNVLNYLVDRGIKRDKFTYAGLNTQNPVGDNRTPQGRSLNRRTDVEVVLSLFEENVSFNEKEVDPNTGYRVEKYKGTTTKANTTKTTENATTVAAPPVELGPDFTEGKIPKAGSKLIKSTNGITIDIDKNSLVSGSSEPINLDFKDYTLNQDIMKKGLTTSSGGCKNLALIGAFQMDFTQEYEQLSINSTKPVIVTIPGVFNPMAKLYSNHKNWTLDTINKLSYNHDKNAYEVSVINNNQITGIFADVSDTVYFLNVKIKGLKPELIKPYVIFDDCNISMCCRQKGKNFYVPITNKSSTYRIRSSYTDYSSKNGDSYSVNYDITNLDLSKLKKEVVDDNIIVYKYKEKIKVAKQKLDKSTLCDQQSATVTQ